MKINPKNKNIGRYFRHKRIKNGLSQEDVARALSNINVNMLSRLERGLSSFSQKTLMSLIKLYKIDIKKATEFFVMQEKLHDIKMVTVKKNKTRSHKNKKLDKMFRFCISYKIKEMRLRENKTRKQLADFLNLPVSKIRQAEDKNHLYEIKGDQIFKLCEFLNATMNDKFFFTSLDIYNVECFYEKFRGTEKK